MTSERLEQLILAHQSSLELFARQWTASPEDCVQEAFLRLYCSDETINNETAWLYRVVRNLAIDQQRSESSRSNREKVVSLQRDLFKKEVGHPIDSDELSQAIGGLADEQREIVIARLWGDLTLEEISKSIGIAISTVHRRYAAAIQQLQQHFEVPCQTRKKK